MLQGLSALLPRIAADALPEAAVYASERLYAAALPARVRPGILACPICGLTATRFLPFGLDQRRNSRCPHCGAVERHRFLWLYLTRQTDLLRGRYRMLHTAPEPFLEQRLRVRPNLRYVSVDRFNPFADRQTEQCTSGVSLG